MAVLDRSVVVVAGGQGCRAFLGLVTRMTKHSLQNSKYSSSSFSTSTLPAGTELAQPRHGALVTVD